MNNELDAWLNSIGVTPEQSQPQPEPTVPQIESDEPTVIEGTPTVPSNLTDDDFNDILDGAGFVEGSGDDDLNEDEGDGDPDWRTVEGMDAMSERAQEALLEAHGILEPGQGLIYRMEDIVTVEPSMESFDEMVTEVTNAFINEETGTAMAANESAASTTPSVRSRRTRRAVDDQDRHYPEDREVIHPNSPTLLMEEATSRFSGAEWYSLIQQQHIILAGLGGIGSWTAIQLARMAPASIHFYDDDTIERANMSGQLYASSEVGELKASTIVNMLTQYTTARHLYAINHKFDEESEAGDIMICGFDSMSARKLFFGKWHEHICGKSAEEKKKCVFIDGRLSLDTLQVFCLTGDDDINITRYNRDYLFSDREADETICSMKQTTFMACMIGSVIVNVFTNFIAGQLNPIIPYDLPFFIEYDSQNMIFKTEK